MVETCSKSPLFQLVYVIDLKIHVRGISSKVFSGNSYRIANVLAEGYRKPDYISESLSSVVVLSLRVTLLALCITL